MANISTREYFLVVVQTAQYHCPKRGNYLTTELMDVTSNFLQLVLLPGSTKNLSAFRAKLT